MMDKKIFDKYELWFVTGSQHLYGEETLAQVAHDSKRIVDGLNNQGELAVKIVWKPTVTTGEEITCLLREAGSVDS